METTLAELNQLFDRQRAAFQQDLYPSVQARTKRLETLERMLFDYRDRIARAISEDFSVHHEAISDIVETGAVIGRSAFYRSKIEDWMAPRLRDCDPATHGGSKLYVMHQPLGVIGNISPWNFPIECLLIPVVDMLAAGNRVICKASDLSPATSQLMREAAAEYFDPELLSVVTGDLELAKGFSTLPWDHLLYTGNTAVGRQVMVEAAKNLTPVTLELGGKNPVLFTDDSIEESAIFDMLSIKHIKSGQVCTSADYALVPRNQLRHFAEVAQTVWQRAYPGKYIGHPDVAGIINDRHFKRVLDLIEDAAAGGAEVVPLHDEAPDPVSRQIAMTLILEPTPGMKAYDEEIFGPVLPVVPYDSVDDAIAHINNGEHPLAAYLFTQDAELIKEMPKRTISGGFCANAVALHTVHPSAPFGGVGHSGTGSHSGYESFVNFSHTKTCYETAKDDQLTAIWRPPYGDTINAVASMATGQS